MKTYQQFIEGVVHNLEEAGSSHPFAKNYQSVIPSDVRGSTRTFHNVKKVSTGTVYTKQVEKDGMSKGTGDDAARKASPEPQVKRGRGRPPGKYGSYKKKVKESLDVISSLDTEQQIEEFLSTLDEETLQGLDQYLSEEQQAGDDNE